MVMAKKGEIQNYCFDKESNISLQCRCGCSFRVFLDYWCFEKVQSHSQLNKKRIEFQENLDLSINKLMFDDKQSLKSLQIWSSNYKICSKNHETTANKSPNS